MLGMIEEAVSKSALLNPEGVPSLEWTYIWLGIRYLTEFSFTTIFFFTATLLFFNKPDSWIAVYLALTFVALGIGQVTSGSAYVVTPTFDRFVFRLADTFSVFSAVYLFYIIPDGRYVPSWTKVASVLWGTMTLLWAFIPEMPFNALYVESFKRTYILSQIVFLLPVISGMYAQIYRWRHAATEEERQQVRWMITGMFLMVIAALVHNLKNSPVSMTEPQKLLTNVVAVVISTGFPVCLSVAVTRYRLWELNSYLSKFLTWAVMSAIGIGVFVLMVGGVGSLLQSPANPILSALASALVTLIFQPMRQRVQRFIDRYLFGFRDDPMSVISLIRERNQSSHTPDRILDEITETVSLLLKIPYVRVDLLEEDRVLNASAYGRLVRDIVQLPLVHQNITIGYLVVGLRAPGEAFNAADLRLLETISWQVAALGHILRLNADLQRSRERLVQVAERERQRLQRDLHDGLGTELTAQMLKIGTARAQVFQKPERADALLEDVEHKLVESVGEVRRLIHNLRPPVLDQLGLIKALELLVNEHRQRDFDIRLETPNDMPRLPPAVEIAAYRIVQEAVTNVVKHANATRCLVSLSLTESSLHLRIEDDGIGPGLANKNGVGLHSMKERAEELGGSLQITPGEYAGTCVQANLPFQQWMTTEVV